MCLMLYLATGEPLPRFTNEDISVEDVEKSRSAVSQWFSLPEVQFIGAPGCSCTFPHVVAEKPVEWFDGIFDPTEDREVVLSSVRALLSLLGRALETASEVQMYPVWDGNEGEKPKGTIVVNVTDFEPEKFFLNEQFLYRIVTTRAA